MVRHFVYTSLIFSSYLIANPTAPTLDGIGGFVVSGTPNNLTVTTTANTTAINWDTFSSGNGEMLTFQKSPTVTGNYYILNTVTGGGASLLNGTLTTAGAGIGNIYLVNPAGITVGSTGQVIAGSFLASTLQLAGGSGSFDPINNPDMTFIASTQTTASNLGLIQSLSGDVTIIGFRVVNSGTISSADAAALGAGINILVQPSSNERIFIEVNAPQGSLGFGIDSSGTITGEEIILKADANPYTLAINQSQTANVSLSSCNTGGAILIAAVGLGPSCLLGAGAIEISGGLTSSGCPISIFGDTIALETAIINASSDTTGGGAITIGSVLSVCPTTNIYIDPNSQIISNAITSGTGGTINIIAETSLLIVGTNSSGNIQATGSLAGGIGGSVGLTSNGYLGLDANVNLSGTTAGTLQVNAPNLYVGGSANYGSNFTAPTFNIVNVPQVITTSALEYALNHGNVTALAEGANSLGNITVGDDFSWTSGYNLSLVALNTIQANYYGQMSSGSISPTQTVLTLTAPFINIGPSEGTSDWPTGFHLTSGSIVATGFETLALYGGDQPNTPAKLSTLNGNQTIVFGDTLLLEAGAASGANAEIKGTNIAIDMESGGLGAILMTANTCSQVFINGTGIQIGSNVPPTSLTILAGSCSSTNPAYIGSLSGLSNINITLTGVATLTGGNSGANNSAAIVSSGGLNGAIVVSALDVVLIGGTAGTNNQAYIASTGNLGAVSVTTVRDLFLTGGESTSGSAYLTSRNTSFTVGRDAIITGGSANLSNAYIEGTNNTLQGSVTIPAVKGLVRRNLMLQGGSNQNAFAEIRAKSGDIYIDALTVPNTPNESWFTFRGGYISGINNAAAKLYVVQNGSIYVGFNSPPNYVNLVGGAGGTDPYAEFRIDGNGTIFVETISDISYLGGVDGNFTHAGSFITGNGGITHIAGRDMNMATGINSPSNVFLETANGIITVEVVRDLNMTAICPVNRADILSNGASGGVDIIIGRDVTLRGNAHIRVDNGNALYSVLYGGTLTVSGCSTIIYGTKLIAPVLPAEPVAAPFVYPADFYYKYTFLYELFYRLTYFKCYDWFEFHDSFWNSTMYTGPGNQHHLDQ